LFAYRKFYNNIHALLDELSGRNIEKRQTSQTDFANILIDLETMKEYMLI
jgi:hypothetical protein